MLLSTVHGVVLWLRDVCFHVTHSSAWRCLRASWYVLLCDSWVYTWRYLMTSWCVLSCYSWLYMALSYDFVICAFILLLTVHDVALWLRDVCFHVTHNCAYRYLMTSWCVLSCYSRLCMASSYDFVTCAFMLPITVPVVALWLRDVCALMLLSTVHLKGGRGSLNRQTRDQLLLSVWLQCIVWGTG